MLREHSVARCVATDLDFTGGIIEDFDKLFGG